ncbi:MAG TPA: non-homologous end-joining DNA ligase [Streptosporangiaceae bacterium]
MTGQSLTAGGIEVALSHTDKVLWPGEDITKGDLIDYYADVAGRMLPFLKQRPVAMARYPDGIRGPRIFQKNVPDYFPDWITRTEVKKQGGVLHHVLCDKPATVVYLANQACIELHVFLSQVGRLDQPDQLVFDLDPPDDEHFGEARRTALLLRDLLEGELGLTTFVKTTGGHGLHVYVPLRPSGDFDAVRGFARQAAGVLTARHPDLTTTEQRKDKRTGPVYLDVMRNAYAQTVVAPYVVRARPGADVATPLEWDEVADSKLTPGRFTLRTVRRRLGEAGSADPWAGVARRRQGLAQAQARLDELAEG